MSNPFGTISREPMFTSNVNNPNLGGQSFYNEQAQSNSGANAQQAFNNVMALRNTYNAEQQAYDNAKFAKEQADKAQVEKEKKIAELEKWLADHKAEYELAKKWIARFNDPMFQGLNSKGIESGDFSGASNYVLQQDQREAEAKKDGKGDGQVDSSVLKKEATLRNRLNGEGLDLKDIEAFRADVEDVAYDLEQANLQGRAELLRELFKEKFKLAKGEENANESEKNETEWNKQAGDIQVAIDGFADKTPTQADVTKIENSIKNLPRKGANLDTLEALNRGLENLKRRLKVSNATKETSKEKKAQQKSSDENFFSNIINGGK